MSDIEITCGEELALDLSGVSLRTEDGTLTVREGGWGRKSRSAPIRGLRKLRILADTSALEFFANDGEAVLSVRWYPEGEKRTLTLEGRGRAAVHRLRPLEIKERLPGEGGLDKPGQV